jgi:Ran GTPase-activating protein (RanGAP) involved in mRNA processing and transport
MEVMYLSANDVLDYYVTNFEQPSDHRLDLPWRSLYFAMETRKSTSSTDIDFLLDRLKKSDPSLRYVTLNFLSEQAMASIVRVLHQNPQIETFSTLGSEIGAIEADLWDAWPSLVFLNTLTMREAGLNVNSCRNLVERTSWKTLISLDLSHNKLGPRGVKALAEGIEAAASIDEGIALESLNLSHTSMGHFGAHALGGVLPATLKWLDLSHNGLGHDGLWKLASRRLSSLKSLRTLLLSHNQIADDGCLELARHLSCLLQLETLDIAMNDIGDTAMETMAKSLSHSTLQTLDLSHNRISATGAQYLASAIGSCGLRTLNLAYNQIEDAGCVAIAKGLLDRDVHISLDVGLKEKVYREEGLEEDVDAGGETKFAVEKSAHLHTLDLSYNSIGDEGVGAFVEHLDEIPTLVSLLLQGNERISLARTRILDMLLKHRESGVFTPARSSRPNSEPLSTFSDQNSLTRELFVDNYTPDTPTLKDNVTNHDEGMRQGRGILASLCREPNDNFVNQFAAVPYDYIHWLIHRPQALLGHGSFGKAYLGTDESLSEKSTCFLIRCVELETNSPMQAVRENILQELQRLQHPSLLSTLAYAVAHPSNSSYAFLCDVRDRVMLYDLINDESSRRDLSWPARLQILHSLAEGVHYLHSSIGRHGRKSMFHGDIQPRNVWISKDHRAQLSDAGLSRIVATDRSVFASGDVVFGSRGYRCVRYERGSCPYTVASDIFSFGIVLAEVLTGTLQLTPNAETRLSRDVYYDCVLPQHALTPDRWAGPVANEDMQVFSRIVGSCLSPLPNKRPTAEMLAHALEQIKRRL